MSKLLEAITFIISIAMIAGVLGACSSPADTVTPSPDKPSDSTAATNQPPDEPLGTPDRVDVVYLYRSNPCHCMAVVGDNIKYAVEAYFQGELSSGKLTFRMLTSDDKANTDLVKKYNSPPFGLFISIVKGKAESIYPVDGIWGLMGKDNELKEFVKTAVEKSLRGET